MAQSINVDITPGLFQPILYYHQNDVGREFAINVQTKDGYTFPSGATATIEATKPSGLGFTLTGTVSDNVVSFTSTDVMTDEFGRFPAQLKISDGTDVIYAANFLLVGERNVHPEGTTDGKQETLIPELTLLVERIEAAAESIHDLTVSATTLSAGSDATATYDSENNSIAFGIPRGADGDVTRSEFNDLKSDLDSLSTNGVVPVRYSVQVGMINASGQDDQNGNNYYRRTDYIDLAYVDSITIDASISIGYWYALYDSSKAFVSRTGITSRTTLDSLGNSGYIRIAAYRSGGLTDEVFTSNISISSSRSLIADFISDTSEDISDINENLSTLVEPELLDGIYLVAPNSSQAYFLRYNISAGDKFIIEATDCEIGKELTVGTQTSSSGSGYTETLFSESGSTSYEVIVEATVDASYFKIYSAISGVNVTIKKTNR